MKRLKGLLSGVHKAFQALNKPCLPAIFTSPSKRHNKRAL